MITSNFIKNTIDGGRCTKLSKEIQSGEYYGVNFIKKHKLTINQFRMVEDCLTELWKNAETKTFDEKVSDIFKKYGFTCIPDEHNINFIIK